MHCTACDSQMPVTYTDDTETTLETLCRSCIRHAAQARDMDQYQFEGLWWDKHWPGKEHHLTAAERRQAALIALTEAEEVLP